MSLLDFFKSKKSGPQYELVEYEIDEQTFRQGIRLTCSTFNGIVVTIGPRVQVKEESGQLRILFDFTIETNPNSIDVTKDQLRPIVGDIIVDLMTKDYNA